MSNEVEVFWDGAIGGTDRLRVDATFVLEVSLTEWSLFDVSYTYEERDITIASGKLDCASLSEAKAESVKAALPSLNRFAVLKAALAAQIGVQDG